VQSAGFSPLIPALLVTGVTLAASAARAEELPKDINAIESLTVEQARALVAEHPGGFFVPYEIEGLRQWDSGRCLSADRAGVYSRSEGGSGGRVRRVVREPGVN
jgi:hypothetical protein